MQDGEIQRELLKETRTAKKALEVAMNIEIGIQNQLKISGTSIPNTTNEISSQSINSVVFKDRGIELEHRQTNLSNLRFAQIVAMAGLLLIDKIALLVENLAKIVGSLITMQKFVANQNNLVNQNLE